MAPACPPALFAPPRPSEHRPQKRLPHCPFWLHPPLPSASLLLHKECHHSLVPLYVCGRGGSEETRQDPLTCARSWGQDLEEEEDGDWLPPHRFSLQLA